MAFFEAYGALCGDAASRSSMGCSTARDCSASARMPSCAPARRWRLGRIGTREAADALQRAAGREGHAGAERGEPRLARRCGMSRAMTRRRPRDVPARRRGLPTMSAGATRSSAAGPRRSSSRSTARCAPSSSTRSRTRPCRTRSRNSRHRAGDPARARAGARAARVGRVHLRQLDAAAARPRQLRELQPHLSLFRDAGVGVLPRRAKALTSARLARPARVLPERHRGGRRRTGSRTSTGKLEAAGVALVRARRRRRRRTTTSSARRRRKRRSARTRSRWP